MPMQGDDVLSLMMEEPAGLDEDLNMPMPGSEGGDIIADAAGGMIKAIEACDAAMFSSLLRDVIEMVILEGEAAAPPPMPLPGGPNVDLATA